MKALALIPLLALQVLNAQTATDTMTLAEKKASVVQLKQNIEAREERLNELVSDIRTLDARTEKRIDKFVASLTGLQDSESSKTRISQLKSQVIEGLRKSIQSYATERRKIYNRLTQDGNSNADAAREDALTKEMGLVDARIQKRVDQIVELAKSMPTGKDVDKYEADSESYHNGWYQENSRISSAWRQNQRQQSATKVEIDELRKALQSNISDLENQRMQIAAAIKNQRMSAAEKSIQEQELGRLDARLESRRNELMQLTMPSTDPSGEPTDKNTADNLLQMFQNARGDVANDQWSIIQKFNEAVDERETILAMKQNLAAREKWLAENPE
ncbi:hypothetical protein [Haloferula sp.]|uniref:hypothetical protein n=1 Tax=Haloferula sp. TaxID=2497595 RepID=UPI003C71133F